MDLADQTAGRLQGTPEPAGEAKLATDEALAILVQALEMDWNTVCEEADAGERWPMGRTIWFSIAASLALWAAVIGAIWLLR